MTAARNVYRNVRLYDDSPFERDVYGLAFQWDRLSPPSCGWSFDSGDADPVFRFDPESNVFRFDPESNVFQFDPGDC